MVVEYFPALESLKVRSFEDVLRILEELFKNSWKYLKNFLGEELDNNYQKMNKKENSSHEGCRNILHHVLVSGK